MNTPVEPGTTRQTFGRALFEALALSSGWWPGPQTPEPPAERGRPFTGPEGRDDRGYHCQRTSGR
ncbi:hypothetical protein ACTVZO_39005 [Streptomyces sp. IBSNAI002]|uniref:hypothetical protein n=1 Tax=Streptomyces sp. IBSNAI002 TaxID=3457500 RepID=UPI003FCFCADB